jgi:hypothetical protein
VKDVMARAPHVKELIDMYSGPDVVTAKQQEGELQRVANILPENIPSSVNRFTDKMLLSLKVPLNISTYALNIIHIVDCSILYVSSIDNPPSESVTVKLLYTHP